MFLTTFVEEAVRLLISTPTSTNSGPYPYHASIFKWLARILNSSGAWELVRNQYLVLSYVQAICKERDSYWVERLYPLVGDLPTQVEGPPEHENTGITGNGNAGAAKGGGTFTKQGNPDENQDHAALRDYGWSISETRNVKPIGVV